MQPRDRDAAPADEVSSKPHVGRPRRSQAGEVDARILDAATDLFLRQGFGRTTMDQVAARAGTGKTTLYRRHATKDLLFAAVVRRSVEKTTEAIGRPSAAGSTRERLKEAGLQLADATLTRNAIALQRVTAAEAEMFPEIAKDGHRIGFGLCVESIARSLSGGTEFADVESATPVARRFVEMVLHPLYIHAFAGYDLEGLRARARLDVSQVADFLLDTSVPAERDIP